MWQPELIKYGHNLYMQWTSEFSAMRGGDAVFRNDFGEDLL